MAQSYHNGPIRTDVPESLKKEFGSLKELAPEAMVTIVKDAIKHRDDLLFRCYKKLSQLKAGEYVYGNDGDLELDLKNFLDIK